MKGQLFRFFTLGVRRSGVVTQTDLLSSSALPERCGPPFLRTERCDLLGHCVAACPSAALRIEGGDLVLDIGLCLSCRACLQACPKAALLPAQELAKAHPDKGGLEVRYHVR